MGRGISGVLREVADLHGEQLYQYLQTAQLDGTPLYEHGFWNLLARTMSSEAYLFARTTLGFDVLNWNDNAVDGILAYLYHTPDVTYQVLDSGYEALPETLQEKFETAGGQVVEGAWLSGFTPTRFRDGTLGVQLNFRGSCQPVKATAFHKCEPAPNGSSDQSA